MESRKKNRKVKKGKKYKMTKRTFVILLGFIVIVTILILGIIYLSSEKYHKRKMEKLISNWAEEYYTEELIKIAPGYIKAKASKGETIDINLNTLEKFGKNIEMVKNKKTGKKCDDINTYVTIKVDKDAKNITKEYKIVDVVLDCFE